MDLAQQFVVVLAALLTSVGVAGIPSASLVAIFIILKNSGVPGAEAAIVALLAVEPVGQQVEAFAPSPYCADLAVSSVEALLFALPDAASFFAPRAIWTDEAESAPHPWFLS